MKIPSLTRALVTILVALAVPLGGSAQTAAAPSTPATPTDADWAVVEQSFKNTGAPRPPPDQLGTVLQWGLRYVKGVLKAAGDFYAKHPEDQRRWTGVVQMVDKFDSWTSGEAAWSDAERQAADAVIAPEERAHWRERLQELRTAANVSADTPAVERLYFESAAYFKLRNAAFKALSENQPPDFAALKAEFDRLVAKYHDQPKLESYAKTHIRLVQMAGATPAQVEQECEVLANSPSEALRKVAADLRKTAADQQRLSDIAFTAVDGRKVDLKDYRGKVVLVDFWATWCGPCIAELPTLRKVYTAYHDKGFEVVGIALENGKLTPKDTPEQVVAKLEVAKKVLTDFTAKNEMPWPQYFDGKFWKNEFAVKYGIQSIPAMFLLDQDGKLVTTAARGEKLEQEVKRLLKLY